MNILVVMIPLSLLLLIGAGVAFFWAVEHDQFDDMQTPALLPLLDDPAPDSAHAANVDVGGSETPATDAAASRANDRDGQRDGERA